MDIQFKRNKAHTSTMTGLTLRPGEPLWFKDKLYVGSVGGSKISNGGTTPSEGEPVRLARYDELPTVPAQPTFSNVTLNATTPQTFASVGGTDYKITWPSSDPWASNYASSTHTHGNITNDGKLQTTDVTVANGDKLVVTDASDSNRIARTSISFDGSTTGKYLSQAGTWVSAPAAANDGVLTVKGDGTYLSVGTSNAGDTFSANAVSAKTITVNHKTRTENTSTGTAQTVNVANSGQSISIVTHTFDGAGHETGKTTTAVNFTQVTAASLGLDSAMHFKGAVSSLPTASTSDDYENGDVIIVTGTNKEYVRSGKTASAAGSWVELGDEGSYAQKTVTVTGTGALSGGGDLTQNRTITHNTSGVTGGSYGQNGNATPAAGGTISVPYITVDTYGHVTGASTSTVTLPADSDEKVKSSAITGSSAYPILTASNTSGNTAAANAKHSTNAKIDKDGYITAAGFKVSGSTGFLKADGSVDTSSYKTVQTAVSDPTASSTTSNTFIDSISQDTNGVITVTKKTVPTPASPNNGNLYVRAMNTASTPADTSTSVFTADQSGDTTLILNESVGDAGGAVFSFNTSNKTVNITSIDGGQI